jgi:hypothetical protein
VGVHAHTGGIQLPMASFCVRLSVCVRQSGGFFFKKSVAQKVARLPRRVAESTPRPKGRWVSYARRHARPVCGSDNPRRLQLFTLYAMFHARASTAAPGKTERIVTTAARKTGNIVTTAARIAAVAAATPQERAAAAVPALRRGADNEQWCCCQRGLQLYQLRAAWLRYLAAQWHLARAVGRRFRGCRAKRLYPHSNVELKPNASSLSCQRLAISGFP